MRKLLILIFGLSSLLSQAQVASPTKFGVVKVGPGLSIDPVTGVLSATTTGGSSGTGTGGSAPDLFFDPTFGVPNPALPQSATNRLGAKAKGIDSLLNSTVIDVALRYGIVSDPYSSTTVTDNVVALMKLRADLSGPGKPLYTLIMPGGGNIYSSNTRWAYGIERLTIDLNGSTLRAKYSGSDDALARPLWIGTVFQSNTLSYTGQYLWKTSYLFNTVSAGNTQITLATPSETANFAVGNRVLLWGRDQIGNGYPPGTRYNEWHVIKAINTSTGVITLVECLENNWNSAWHDVPDLLSTGKSVGKPRILNLDIPGQVYSRYLEIKNGTLGDPTGGGYGHVALAGERLIFNNVKQEKGYWWPSEDKYAEYNDCTFQNAEWDKICGTVIANRCYLASNLAGGTGINKAYTNNCVFGNSAYLGAREWYIDGCTFTSNTEPSAFLQSLGTDFSANPIRLVSIKNSKFQSGPSSQTEFHIDVASFTSFAIPAVSGTDIMIPFGTYTDANANLAHRIQEGQTRMFKSDDGTNGGLVTGWVFDPAYNSNQGAWRISGTWSTPTAGNTWEFSNVQNVIDGGNNVSLDGKPLWGPQSMRFKSNQVADNGGRVMRLTEKDFKFATGNTDAAIKVNGWISKIEVNVKKIHKNSTSSFMEPTRTTPGFTRVAKINLLQAGRRTIDEFSTNGLKTSDDLPLANLPQWTNTLNVIMYGSGKSVAPADLPEFDLLIHYTQFSIPLYLLLAIPRRRNRKKLTVRTQSPKRQQRLKA